MTRSLGLVAAVCVLVCAASSYSAHGVATLEVTKTVTTTAGSCSSGSDSLTIDEGEAVKYCYEVENTGTAAARNVVVYDDNGTPEGADDILVSLAGLTDQDGDTTPDGLAPGASASGSLEVTLSTWGDFFTGAYAFGTDVTSDEQVSDTAVPVTVTVNDLVAALQVTKTGFRVPGSCPGTDTLTVDEGDTVQFCHKVENIGDAAALDISVEDVHTIPGLTPVIVSFSGFSGLTDEDGDTVQDDLAPGASVMVEDHHLSITYTTPGLATNTATVSGVDATSATPVSASDTATVAINDRVAELRITKTGFRVPGSCPGTDTLTVDEGDTVQFCHKVENIGDAAALDISVEDVHTIPGLTPVIVSFSGFSGLTDEDGDTVQDDLAPGASVMVEDHHLSMTYTTPGLATNTATVSGVDATSATPVSASDTATVDVTNIPPTFHDCLDDIFATNDRGLPSAVVHWTPPTASDPSGVPPTVVSTHSPGDTFPVGPTAVTYTATDGDGGQSACTFDVIVENTEPPVVTIVVPQDNARFVVGEEVPAQWTATSLVGLQSTDATAPSGGLLDTTRQGCFTFTVLATDVTGLTATEETPWCAIFRVGLFGDPTTQSESWTFIDRWLPRDERPLAGIVPLTAIYPIGTPVRVFFNLWDAGGNPSIDCVATLTVTRVQDPAQGVTFDDVLESVVRYVSFRYDEESGGYLHEFLTWGYPGGYYDLWLAVNGVFQERIRIEVAEGTP
jgi:uncharacterized repeat protein (TIGR01451 family)